MAEYTGPRPGPVPMPRLGPDNTGTPKVVGQTYNGVVFTGPPTRRPQAPMPPASSLRATVGTAAPKGGSIASAPFKRPSGSSTVQGHRQGPGLAAEMASRIPRLEGNLAAIRPITPAGRGNRGRHLQPPAKMSPRMQHAEG